MSVDGSGSGTAMSQNLLDQTQLHPCFQKVRGIRMTQRVYRSRLLDPALLSCRIESITQIADIHRAILAGRAWLQTSRKKPAFRTVESPECTQRLQGRF